MTMHADRILSDDIQVLYNFIMADKIHPAKNDDAANQSVNERPSLNWNGVKVKEFFQLYQQCVSLYALLFFTQE